MNKSAQALGRLAKGVPKKFTAAEREKRRLRLAVAREQRWLKGKARIKAVKEG